MMSNYFSDDELKQFSGPSNISQEEMQQLAMLVANAIAEGDDLDDVVKDLTNSGWEQSDAESFVSSIQYHIMEAQQPQASAGSGIPGWIFWIGFLLLFNYLSHQFGWGLRIF